MTPAEGSDLDNDCPTPQPGSFRCIVRHNTQVFGTACLDLCLFNSDLSEVLTRFSNTRNTYTESIL